MPATAVVTELLESTAETVRRLQGLTYDDLDRDCDHVCAMGGACAACSSTTSSTTEALAPRAAREVRPAVVGR